MAAERLASSNEAINAGKLLMLAALQQRLYIVAAAYINNSDESPWSAAVRRRFKLNTTRCPNITLLLSTHPLNAHILHKKALLMQGFLVGEKAS